MRARPSGPAIRAAGGIDQVTDRSNHHGAARRGKRRTAIPLVGGGIEYPDGVDRIAHGERIVKPADLIDLAPHDGGAGMMHWLRQRRSEAPFIFGDIVDLNARDRFVRPEAKAAHDIDASIEHDGGRFVLLAQQGRDLAPTSAPRGRLPKRRWGAHKGTGKDEDGGDDNSRTRDRIGHSASSGWLVQRTACARQELGHDPSPAQL